MTGQDIHVQGPDGKFQAYLATPAAAQGPGIIVIQEIFGVNAVIREIADDLARQGYFALAPDLFWRIEPAIQLTDKTDAEWKRAFELYQKFDVNAGVRDTQAAISHLRHLPGVSGKVGSVGYCLGGLLAFLTGTRTDSNANVGYYGVGIEGRLSEKGQIRHPMLVHIAEKDQFVPPAAQTQIQEALQSVAHVSAHIYPGADHAFARQGGQHYDAAAATLANNRTAEFFRTHLH
ncbi:MAG TPA: carboxymethylenebutenolidase [Alphaproteobacteria bacterium]|nr:carboxymethylenebutenolidase [Alphaproteobacteria bacterium]